MDSNTLNLYHIFVTVADVKSLSGAARLLYISQPAISKALSRLEAQLDAKLFYRSPKGVTLTPEGEALYSYASKAFESLSAGIDNLNHIKNLGLGYIRIGVSSTLCKHMLLPYLQDYVRHNPHVQIIIQCQSTQQTLSRLENGELDIGLIAQPRVSSKLLFIPLGTIKDTFAATPGYINHLQERIEVSDKDIIKYASLILLDKNNLTRKYMDKYLSDWQIPTERTMEVSSMELLIDFTKTGLGAGCIIREFIETELENGELVELATPTPIPARKVCFAYTASAAYTAPVQSFLDMICR